MTFYDMTSHNLAIPIRTMGIAISHHCLQQIPHFIAELYAYYLFNMEQILNLEGATPTLHPEWKLTLANKMQQSIDAIGADQGLDTLAIRDVTNLILEDLDGMTFKTEMYMVLNFTLRHYNIYL